jgi:hypothetical protein
MCGARLTIDPQIPRKKAAWRIGVVGPFTGKQASYGRLLRAAARQIGLKYKGGRERFVFLDDAADPRLARAAARAMVELKVSGVVGHFSSRCARAVTAIYHQGKLPLILPASTSTRIKYIDQGYVVRYCPDNLQQCRKIVEILVERKAKSVSIFCDRTDYGRELRNLLIPRLPPGVGFNPRSRSWRVTPQTEGMVLLGTHYNCHALCLRLMRGGYKGFVLACDDCGIADFMKLAGRVPYELQVAIPDRNYGELAKAGIESMVRACLYDEPLERRSLKSEWRFSNTLS